MTRETKFALIIGFTLILVAGVLITDHFSGANRDPVADLSGIKSAPEPIPTTSTDRGPASATNRPQEQARNRPTPIEPRPLVQIDQTSRDDLTLQPRERAPEQLPQEREVPRERETYIPQNPPRDDGLERSPWFTPVDDSRRPLTGPLPQERPTTTQPNGPASGQPNPVAPPPSGSTPPPAQPEPVWHTVESGDSLYTIARQYYGDGNQWRRIAEANPQRIGSNASVRTGVRLIIPDAAPRSTPPSASPALTTPATPTPTNPPASQPASTSARTYTVKTGDTLSLIAQRELGTMTRMQEIIDLNRDKIAYADDIRIGQVLRLPGSSSATPPSATPTRETPRESARPAAAPRTYTVKEGDSLAKIAREFLGSADRIEAIMIANPKIKDENKIFPGMVINLPAR